MRLKTGFSLLARRLFQMSSISRGFGIHGTEANVFKWCTRASRATLYLSSASVIWYNVSFGQFHTDRPIEVHTYSFSFLSSMRLTVPVAVLVLHDGHQWDAPLVAPVKRRRVARTLALFCKQPVCRLSFLWLECTR